jgi:ectoine hydroxylase-related dioxygenase (phytanoyl-CoA dioxygenase family)
MQGTALAPTFEVDTATIDEFQAKGHALVRGLCSREEVDAYRDAIVRAARQRNPEPPPMELRDTYGKAFIQSINLWRLGDDVKAFVWSPRFARVAAALLGVGGVRLYHDQALFKEPGGGPTPWHQDQVYWPLDTTDTITMWMPLVDVPDEVGSMTFASGTNLLGDVGASVISDASEEAIASIIRERGLALHTYGGMRAGDATFHAGWTLHRAGPNPTPAMREVMTVIWYADGARATTPENRYQELDLKMWLKGTEPGEVADGERNPRLWPPAS